VVGGFVGWLAVRRVVGGFVRWFAGDVVVSCGIILREPRLPGADRVCIE